MMMISSTWPGLSWTGTWVITKGPVLCGWGFYNPLNWIGLIWTGTWIITKGPVLADRASTTPSTGSVYDGLGSRIAVHAEGI